MEAAQKLNPQESKFVCAFTAMRLPRQGETDGGDIQHSFKTNRNTTARRRWLYMHFDFNHAALSAGGVEGARELGLALAAGNFGTTTSN